MTRSRELGFPREETLMQRSGFTLVELVVVILVLGILGGVAAPKMFDTADNAAENAAKESLSAIRRAIEMFAAVNGRYPASDGSEVTFKSELLPFLRKFPVLGVGPDAARDDVVVMSGDAGPPSGDNSPTEAWKYYYNTGDFIINVHKKSKVDNTVYFDEL
jgi:prepilin-type N-terminal cleavage/methylation domain-containing protein